jgi:hypothetical protein
MSTIYPGFTLNQFFSQSPITILEHQSKKETCVFSKGKIEFIYNEYGYRTHSFQNITNNYILISGCSLTEGHGLDYEQSWGAKIEKNLNLPVINLAKGGANGEFVSQNLCNWLNNDYAKPKIVIAQWPNPFRAIHWQAGQAQFILNQIADNLYKLKITQGVEHFYSSWVKSIITLNDTCKQLSIPILNLCFEGIDTVEPVIEILSQYDITLHMDLKLPGQTWHFDSAALDNSHHSEWCTEQWATRILTLVNNML